MSAKQTAWIAVAAACLLFGGIFGYLVEQVLAEARQTVVTRAGFDPASVKPIR